MDAIGRHRYPDGQHSQRRESLPRIMTTTVIWRSLEAETERLTSIYGRISKISLPLKAEAAQVAGGRWPPRHLGSPHLWARSPFLRGERDQTRVIAASRWPIDSLVMRVATPILRALSSAGYGRIDCQCRRQADRRAPDLFATRRLGQNWCRSRKGDARLRSRRRGTAGPGGRDADGRGGIRKHDRRDGDAGLGRRFPQAEPRRCVCHQ